MTGRVDTSAPAPEDVGGMRGVRTRVRSTPAGRVAWRVGVTVVGVAVIALGVVLLPLPGPGWLIIFAGLGVLGTEYTWARRLLTWLRDLVLRWTRWAARQHIVLRGLLLLAGLIFLAAVAVACWYLVKLL